MSFFARLTGTAQRSLERTDTIVASIPSANCVTIDNVPPEILIKIFKAGHRSTSDRALFFPLLISRISRRWRDVALNSPTLWTTIHFGEGLMKSEDLLNLCLERSQKCLLDVRLDFFWWSHIHTCAHILPRTLLQQIARWRTLVVKLSCTKITVDLLAFLSTERVPTLTSFEMEYEGHDINFRRPVFKGECAPLLSSMTLRGSLAIVRPPFTSLTRLQIGPDGHGYRWQATELKSVLEGVPALKSLVFRDNSTIMNGVIGPIGIPSLFSLEISCGPSAGFGDHIPSLFEFIGAPNLESLILDFPEDDMMSAFIQSFCETPLSAKFPRLQTLALHLHRVPDHQLIELCSLFPAVTRILSTQGSGHALLQLLDSSSGDVRWQQLENIPVAIPMHMEHLDLLCTVLTSRATAGYPISRLDVSPSFFHDVPRDRIQWLRGQAELDVSMMSSRVAVTVEKRCTTQHSTVTSKTTVFW